MKPDLHYSPEGSSITIIRRDRRLFARARLLLPIKFMREDGRNGSGKTVNISPNGVQFVTGPGLKRGEPLVIYIHDIGRLSGQIIRSNDGRIAMVFDINEHKRDRLADQLTWLLNKDRLGLTDDRKTKRRESDEDLQVTCEDGRTIECEISDISLVGVALTTRSRRPMVGESVTVGNKPGKVTRYVEKGFAVEFQRGTGA
ncbi:MAG: pilus assembly protein PilZ [Ponticaulis sp.]|nr:pilus assembly protein PilZ [Ponticaulis sp.]